MRRTLLIAVAAASFVAAGAETTVGAARATCRVPLHTVVGWEAVFGTRSTRAGAESLRTKATRRGFQNLVIERVGCPKWAVALHGLKNKRQGSELAAEARAAGFTVVLKCNPVLDLDGDWQAVFGRVATRTAAERLRTRAARKGFVGLEIYRDICTRRFVVELDNIKSLREAREFEREARRAGFAVTIKHH